MPQSARRGGYFFLVLFSVADGLMGPAGNPLVLGADALAFTATFFGFFSSRLPLPMIVLLAHQGGEHDTDPKKAHQEIATPLRISLR